MRIGIDLSIQELPEPTGVERAQATLLDALLGADVGHEYVLFTPGRVPDRWRDHPQVTVVEGSAMPLWFWRESVVPSAMRKNRVEVFHSPVAAIPLRAGCPLLATVHEVPWAESDGALGDHANAHKLRLHLAANFAARLLCVSERTAEQVRTLHPDAAARIRVTPHGLDESWLTGEGTGTGTGTDTGSATGTPSDTSAMPAGIHPPFVLAVGRLRQKKNLMRLLEAFARRLGGGGAEQLVLVGPEDDAAESLRARAAQSDLAGRVVFAGFVKDDTLRALYRGASCVVHPSLFEGFGLPVIEAMAAGVPVMVSTQGAVSEAVGNLQKAATGQGAETPTAVLAVDGEDDVALGLGLCRLLDEMALRAALIEAGRVHVSRCSAEAAAARVLAVYEELR